VAHNEVTPEAAEQARNAAEKAVAEFLNLPNLDQVLQSLRDAQRLMDDTDQWGTPLAHKAEYAMSHLGQAISYAKGRL